MKEKFVDQMITDYDSLLKVPMESYNLVIPSLNLVSKRRGELIKGTGEIDTSSRYICKGFIGYYKQIQDKKFLFAIYQASDTVFDLDSYRSATPSQNELVAISDVTYLEFPIEAENEVILRDPNLLRLALLVNQRISTRQSRIHEISIMDPESGYPILLEEFKGIGMALTIDQLASFFQVSVRTINRMKQTLNQ